MALQTTYGDMPAAQVGRRKNMEEWNGITRTLEGATPLAFAQPVMRGAGVHGCVVYDGAGKFLGISEADPTKVHATPDRFEQYDSVPIMDMGVIWGMSGGACTPGGLVYWIAASGKYTDTAAGNILIPNAEFEDGAAAADTHVSIRLRRVPAAPAA